MHEKAARLKLRFPFKGECSIEDLWDIPIRKVKGEYVSELDTIFCTLDSLKQQSQKGLLSTKSEEDMLLTLKIDIVRHIVNVKLEEYKARENAVLKAGKKQKLLGILADKQDEQYRDMSIEELNKLVDDL